MNEITKDQFMAFVAVQESGVTNMFDSRTVAKLSGLSKPQIITIIKNYDALRERYEGVPNGQVTCQKSAGA